MLPFCLIIFLTYGKEIHRVILTVWISHVISVTVNTVRNFATAPILMICCSTFGTGKLWLTVHSVVSVPLAREAPQWIRDVSINLHPKKSDFCRSRKDGECKREDDGAGIYSVTITLDLTSVMPGAAKLSSIYSSDVTERSLHHMTPFMEFILRRGTTFIGQVASTVERNKQSE